MSQVKKKTSRRQDPLSSWGLLRFLHFFLYCIGARILRFFRRRRTKLHRGFVLLCNKLRQAAADKKEHRRLYPHKRLLKKAEAPFLQTAMNLHQRSKNKEIGLPFLSLKRAVAPISLLITHFFNLALPAAALIFLFLTVQHFGTQTYGLRVEYNNQYVGYISSEANFSLAEKQVRNRTIGSDYKEPDHYTPLYSFEIINPEQLTPLDLLTNNIISASGNKIQEAAGLYVDGKFMGAVEDGDSLLSSMKTMKDADRQQNPKAEVSFVQDIKLSRGLYPVVSVIDLDTVLESLNAEKGSTVTYTIQKGDSPYELAIKFGIPLQNLYDLNPETTQHMLIGDELLIQKPAPFLQKRVVASVSEDVVMAFETEKEIDQNKDSSYEEITQTGRDGLKRVWSQVTTIDGCETEHLVMREEIIEAAVKEISVVGSLSSSSPSEAKVTQAVLKNSGERNLSGFIWPVDGGSISCSIYGYSGHTGNDIAANPGTAIFASKSGTVAYSNWSRGYGYNVLLTHADGTKTRYAHCSALLVSAGQQVTQGQQIAQVGRTGNASCNHCHFEIIQNGQFLDSRNYVGSR